MQVFIILLAGFALFDEAWGHGMMLEPAGRSSRWRSDPTAPENYNDNELFCGGFAVQYSQNEGKCGICGDNYQDPTPRANELGGLYGGEGVIVQTYENTTTIDISFNLTQNHLGYIYVELCNLDEHVKESEECFDRRLKFPDGKDKFYVGEESDKFDTTASLPEDLKCKHCVLRWTYRTGNNWGFCAEGEADGDEHVEGALGCGDQETFKSCADISIQ